MAQLVKRIVQPVVRLTTMQKVDHKKTFEAFAKNLGHTVVEQRVREEPRIVSFMRVAVR